MSRVPVPPPSTSPDMAAAFRPVNSPAVVHHSRGSSSAAAPPSGTASSSSSPLPAAQLAEPAPAPAPTPAPATAATSASAHALSYSPDMADDATTPTRATFGSSSLAGQKPLPSSPFPHAVQIPKVHDPLSAPKRGNSQHSSKSGDSEDVEMDGSDGDTHQRDENEVSDQETENADGKSSSKKKKSQRFFCTDYPPCDLSFTRSEHLARHIRKHTGERPFQCHCSRRFSRLDNLRQHAQTVHVNEDIPIDSLAATGARFQRQVMRPERVRQATGRARASTAGSTSSIVRGHSKSLSTSSASSIGSGLSTRDRPPPLLMAADSRAMLPLDSYSSARDGTYPQYRPVSPSDFSTPTSTTFSVSQDSPRWSGFASPTSSHSRSHSLYAESRPPNRRLSVPAPGNSPFQAPIGTSIGRHSFSPGAINTSNSGTFSSTSSSLLSSPTLAGSNYSRRDSVSSASDEAWRRRTWHPDSQNFHPSRLSNVSTPGHYDASQSPPLAQPFQRPSSIRLPGIESFDPVPRRPSTPPKRNSSPMMVDSEPSNPTATLPGTASLSEERRSLFHWDMSLHRGLTRLEIAPVVVSSGSLATSNVPVPRDSANAWANDVSQAEHVRLNPPTIRFDTPSYSAGNAPFGPRSLHQNTMSAPNVSAPRDRRRHAWCNDALQTHAEEVRTTRIERMVHPNIGGFSSFPARDSRTGQSQQISDRPDNSKKLRGLDALVAVATGEGNTAAAY